MRLLYQIALLFCMIAWQASSLQAQVIINEVCAANRSIISDNYGDFEDWIELYNAGADPVDLGGYFMSDKLSNPTKWQIPAGTIIGPGNYRIVFASGRNESSFGVLHASFKITQTNQEFAVLADPSGTVIQSFEFVKTNRVNHSYGRNAAGEWRVYTMPTPGAANAGSSYTGYTPKPGFSLPAGFYNAAQTVTLTGPSNGVIRYTLDGSEPTQTSTTYSNPINITHTSVLRARVFSNDPAVLPGLTQTNTYFINITPHVVPVISIAGEELPQLLDGAYIDPIGNFEYFENQEIVEEAVGEFNKHGNDSWAYAQRGIDYITRDQFGYDDNLSHPFFPNRDRTKFQRLILKAAANDNYPALANGAHIRDAFVHTLAQRAGMELDARAYRPCVLYVNGEYWGVYEMREKADDADYTEHYYNQGEFDIDYIKTWGNTWEEYGSWNDWYALHNFITTNDMSLPANYAYVTERFNVLSLIDYMILNMHVVCKDWLNWNTAWWRGRNPEGQQLKWRYTLWDLDATFDHYINYTSIPDDSPTADPCDNETYAPQFDPEGHVDLIISLMNNPDFHALYVNRYADLNNHYLSCEYTIALLDSLVAAIEPEMHQHVARWGGQVSQWQDNVQDIRDFMLERCSFINGGIVGCYDVSGPYPLTVQIQPANSPNKVKINTMTPPSFPFSGEYFGDIPIYLEAEPAQDWSFDHWQVANHVFGPDELSQAISLSLTTDEQIVAWFVPDVPCPGPQLLVIDSTTTMAHLNWDGPFNFISYEIRWRPIGSTTWEVVANLEDEYTITGLDECTTYELQMRTICGSDLSDYLVRTFSTACISSIDNPADQISVLAYPNPFTQRLTLDVDLPNNSPLSATLFNAAGSAVARQDWDELPSGHHNLQWELPAYLSPGLYILQLNTAEGLISRKLIKE